MKPLEKIRVTSNYTGATRTRTYKINGKKVTDHHYGIDVVDPTKTNKIYATADGKVIKVVNKGERNGTMCQIRLKHKEYQSAYYHIASGSAKVKVNEYVSKGQHIADVGDTGVVSAKHLHYQIDKGSNKNAIDPTEYVKGKKELDGLVDPSKEWKVGTYRVLYHKYLRTSPEVKTNNKEKYKDLSATAKSKCIKDNFGYAKYKIGVTIKLNEFKTDTKGNIWGRTNTLWVCVEDSSGHQVQIV